MPPDAPATILFDGVCNLCHASVNFIIDRDPKSRFRFAALQWPSGRALIKACGRDPDVLDTLVLVEDGRCYTRSTAALRIARHLPGAWPLLAVFLAVPKPLRDPIYRLISRRRYRWFGRQDACRVPTPDLQERFLDEGGE
jgi:predicted DCC family thiol-disulfide oxidoreductase YuxK